MSSYSFKKNTEATAAPTATKEVVDPNATKVTVRLVQAKEDSNLVAFVSLTYKGMFFNNIAVKTNKNGEAYFQVASRKRLDKDGNPVMGEDGYPMYDDYYGPASAEMRKEWEAIIMPAVQEALNNAAA